MELEAAKTLLNECVREELRDHAFGDVEVYWMKDDKEVATGYFSGGMASVGFTEEVFNFDGDDARMLRPCGSEGAVERNDETGPDNFTLGATMPGLTRQAVRDELTGGA